ncbi:MAG: glucose-1-phosphate thymidylyltransferase [Cyclobacteriaceae bacterium]|nr:glucose-1-phosphate thymidylyltransferase [Cyclobacteriaceae bacterium]MCH8517831.1 glucose-1-phosphate thymidylyltransferase [Cyclobacteriaceae bacterium]
MKPIVLLDTQKVHLQLAPLTLTKPASKLRCGILTIEEKYMQRGLKVQTITQVGYLKEKFENFSASDDAHVFILSNVIPTEEFLNQVQHLEDGQAIHCKDNIFAIKTSSAEHALAVLTSAERVKNKIVEIDLIQLSTPMDLFMNNGDQIKADFKLLSTKDSKNYFPIADPHTIVYGDKDAIFIEEGVSCKAAIINAENGPVYIGKHAKINEGSIIQGPVAICDHAEIRIGAKIRPDTTVGPNSKVGGEVSNSIFMAYSNKAHDGFLGNSVIGEWCNLGADTNSSNLKNNYSPVSLYSYLNRDYRPTQQLFCGLIMGDYSKSGINTMFNTATVVGVSANVYGADFPPKFIPSFSWGGAQGFQTYLLDKATEAADRMMQRRQLALDEQLQKIFKQIHISEQ